MKRFGLPALAAVLLLPGAVAAQHTQQTEPVEGLRDNTPGVHALTGARVVTAPGEALDDATVLIRDGVIQDVGQGVAPPDDARVWDLEGHTIYPGFIDAHAPLGLDEPPENGENGARHWNPQVRAHFDAGTELDDGSDDRHALRSQGFTMANAVPRLGIFRGQASVVSLNNASPRERVVESGVAQSVGFSRSTELGNTYPNSPMGAIALMRQTLHDAEWHERAWETYRQDPAGLDQPEWSEALDALNPAIHGEQPLLFEARQEEEYLRAAALAEEFPGTSPWVRGSGEEYRILDAIQDSDMPLIVPLAFPDAPEVETPEEALGVSLADLRHWYLAPESPGRLAEAGVEFSLTADGLENGEDFLPNLREAVHRGLDRTAALAALTTHPAGLLGIDDRFGTLEGGKVANAVVVEGDLFDDDAEIRDVWVKGERYVISTPDRMDPRGEWLVASVDDQRLEGSLRLEGSPGHLEGAIELNGQEVDLRSATVLPEAGRLHLAFPGQELGVQGLVRLSASLDDDQAFGWSEFPDGTGPSWRAERVAPAAEADGGNGDSDREVPEPAVELTDIRPNMAYGREEQPQQPEHVLVRGATLWTQGPDGTIEDGDLLVSNGQVEAVGQNLEAPAGTEVIDAQGKHVTPGLIDAHLHSGTHGVNETGDAIVPEVRLGDVVTHNTSWTYRQAAGGLTTAHVKHGSANPIGGENVFVKMRWGGLPDELKLDHEHRTVKFALGENPKGWGERYPGTRMGTHQLIRDNFKAALDYRDRWEEWEANGEGIPPRRDFRMEAIVGILEEEIGIQSHGYRQDEFLMLVRLAEEFDFNVQAIQHGVEAYKIAPELAESGVGAVVWSDWSSFKIEAYDATVYNARLLNEAGVLTSLHSDNSHIASRMNWEAGKMVRAGMDEEDALALVTNNTAEVLGIDDRVGSLEAGKDADFVIWNGHPLSQFTRAEQTWIDGRRYFDLDEHRQLTDEVERERAALIQLLLDD